MKKFALCFITLICIFLSACAEVNFNVEQEMRPPLLSKDQEEIQIAMRNFTSGNDTRLIYPKSGKFMMPVIPRDKKDGVYTTVFTIFSINDGNKKATKLAMLKRNGNKWVVVSSAPISTGVNCEVEDVDFGKMSQNGNENILIGWSTQQRRFKELIVFEYTDQELREVMSLDYADKVLVDLDEDGLEEVVWVDRPLNSEPCLKVAKLQEGKEANSEVLYCYALLKQAKNIIGHSDMVVSKLKNGSPAVFVNEIVYDSEGTQKEMMITEVIEYKNKNLFNLIYQEEKNVGDPHFDLSYLTLREKNISLRDVDGDGCVEVPGEQAIFYHSGLKGDVDEASFRIVNWRSFSEKEIKIAGIELVNSWAQYYLKFLPNWFEVVLGRVEGASIKVENAVLKVVPTFNSGTYDQLLEVFGLTKMKDGTESQQLVLQVNTTVKGKAAPKALEKFAETERFVYYVRIPDLADNGLHVTKEALKEMIRPMGLESNKNTKMKYMLW